MKIIDKVCEKIGLSDPADTVNEEREKEIGMDDNTISPNNVVNLHSSSKDGNASYKMRVVVIEPKTFDDAQQVANCLKEKRPVVVNFENTEEEAAKRIIDFVSGTTYALSGEIKKVGHNVFLCAPSNVNVSYTQEQKTMSTEMPWLKQED